MPFPVVTYGCESWTTKKTEHQRIDAFELRCWRRLLRVPWTAKEIQPVHPKGNQSECSLEGLMLKLKLQYFGHLTWRVDSLKKTDAGRDCGQKEKGTTEDEMAGWHHWLDGCESEWTPGVGDGQGGLACCDSWGRKESDTTERLNWLTDWMNDLVVFPTFFSLSLNLAIRSSWSEPQLTPSLVFADCIDLHLWLWRI